MVEPNLNSGEAILHRTQTIIIRGVRHEAIFATDRIILVASETGSITDEIPYTGISLAAAGFNRLREPTITLTSDSPDGKPRTTDLIFIRLGGEQHIMDLEKCLAVLRDRQVPVEADSTGAGPAFSGQGQRILSGEPVLDELAIRPAVPDWTVFGSSRKERQPVPVEEPDRSPVMIIAVALILIIAVVAGLVLAGQVLMAKNTMASRNDTGSVPISTIAPLPPTVPVSPLENSGPASAALVQTVPSNGVWVRVSCPGNYSGYIGALGRQIRINSTGDQFFKIPVENAMIEGSLEKMDGSSDKLVVGIYNGGELIEEHVTTIPWGVVDIHVPVGPALGNPVVTEVPVLVTTVSPYASLPTVSIPASGVWVRVFSPGNYTGTIRANGLITGVNSTGDKLYHIPMTGGIIDSSIEKTDGTAETLIVEVYNKGNLVSRAHTTTPLGVTNIHTNV